ncbi:hypothetical protein F511_19255 [Dorcoceras hygrometricum]|uniref:Uncharacterized protein n=1 Tax=Dorcoceras hygrometricum TaxID=472368 RepID=A0A2Z7CQR5_9LAMI|nr:hypothetical protein F511_19255 [Dorcoceras hygrometricum]
MRSVVANHGPGSNPRRKLAVATVPETSPDDGRTAAAAAITSRGSSIAAPSATHGRAPRAAHSSTPAAHQARNRCTEQRPATVLSYCPYRATCARDSGTNRPAIAQRFARPAANIPATTQPHLLCNQCVGQRPLSAAMRVKRAHHSRAYARSGGWLPSAMAAADCTRNLMDFGTDGNSSSRWLEQVRQEAAARGGADGGAWP